MKLFFYFDLVFEADVVYVLGKRKLAVNEIHIKRTNYMTTKNVLGTSSKNKNLQWGQGQSLFASESVKPNILCLFFFFMPLQSRYQKWCLSPSFSQGENCFLILLLLKPFCLHPRTNILSLICRIYCTLIFHDLTSRYQTWYL